LRCLGHVERMSEERVVKRLYQNTPEGSRSVGRPRLRWMDDVREDLRRMGVTNWRIRAHRRDDWKMVMKEAKVLHGLYSHGVVVVGSLAVPCGQIDRYTNRRDGTDRRSVCSRNVDIEFCWQVIIKYMV